MDFFLQFMDISFKENMPLKLAWFEEIDLTL